MLIFTENESLFYFLRKLHRRPCIHRYNSQTPSHSGEGPMMVLGNRLGRLSFFFLKKNYLVILYFRWGRCNWGRPNDGTGTVGNRLGRLSFFLKKNKNYLVILYFRWGRCKDLKRSTGHQPRRKSA